MSLIVRAKNENGQIRGPRQSAGHENQTSSKFKSSNSGQSTPKHLVDLSIDTKIHCGSRNISVQNNWESKNENFTSEEIGRKSSGTRNLLAGHERFPVNQDIEFGGQLVLRGNYLENDKTTTPVILFLVTYPCYQSISLTAANFSRLCIEY